MTARNLKTNLEKEFADLESQLAGTLKRVSAPSDLAQRLRLQVRIPSREVIAKRLKDWNRLFFIFGGVMSGMLLFVTLARALYYMTGRKA